MTGVTLTALLSHWMRHKVQFATLFAGLVLATALWSGVQSINAQARKSYDAAASGIGQQSYDRLVSAADLGVDDFVALRRQGYLVSPELRGRLDADGTTQIELLGIDALTSPPRPGLASLNTDNLNRFLSDKGLLLASPETALALDAQTSPSFPDIQVSAEVPIGTAITDIKTAQRLLRVDGFSSMVVLPDQPFGLAPLKSLEGYSIETGQDATDLAKLTQSFHLNLTAFGLLAFAVGLFIVQSSIGLAFEQRRSSFRTLRAIGVSLKRLIVLLSIELGLIALAAGIVGILLGYGIAAVLLPGVAGTLRGLYGASVSGELTFEISWAISALAMTLAGAAMAGAQAMWRVVKMPILAPALPRAWAIASGRSIRRQAVFGSLLLAISAGLAIWGHGQIAGFACLGALLIGAAILLPPLASVTLAALTNVPRSPMGQWALADTKQQVPALSLALMALLLALSANVGVSTMVGSFRGTFIGWLDQRLAAELYVTARTASEAQAIRSHIAPQVTASLPIWSVEHQVSGQPVDIFGIVDHDTYRNHWPLLDNTETVWDQIAQNAGAMVNEQFARRNDVALGDTLQITRTWALPVVGIYSDYGNPNGQLITGIDALTAEFPNRPILRYAYRLPKDRTNSVAQDIRAQFNLPASAVINQSDVKQMSLRVFDQTFLVTGALNILTLAVASFALLTSLLTLSSMRLPQLAPVWALGLTTKALSRIEFWRTIALALATWLLSLPVGLALAWVLLSFVNVEAFGWKLPMSLFPADWLKLAALTVLAAAAASFWPIYKLRRMPSGRLLRVFANER